MKITNSVFRNNGVGIGGSADALKDLDINSTLFEENGVGIEVDKAEFLSTFSEMPQGEQKSLIEGDASIIKKWFPKLVEYGPSLIEMAKSAYDLYK